MGFIIAFLDEGAFDDVTTHVLGEAFDAVCRDLHDTGQPAIVREVIAKRIIRAAQQGERDPAKLRDVGLEALGSGQRGLA